MGSEPQQTRDPIAESVASALRDLTLPAVLPDAAVVAGLQRSLAEYSGTGPHATEIFAGRYRLERLLGRGGMGAVWLAYDVDLARAVAIKMLHGATEPAALARMRREARAVARLTHPNIVSVYDVVLDSDPPFIVMEYVQDGDLRQWLRREPAPTWIETLVAFEQAALGLEAAHRAGLVHRDFKPANVMIGRGRVRVVDFGLVDIDPRTATIDDGSLGISDVSFTRTGAHIGTPAYMAPEQHAGAVVTSAADVFAFACSLHEALYGARPHAHAGWADLITAKNAGPPSSPPATVAAARVPARLYPIIARGLAPDPRARWPTMGAFVHALQSARKHPSRAVPVAALVLVAAASWCAVTSSTDPCMRDVAAFGDQWTRQRAAVVEAIDGSGASPALRDAADVTLRDFGEKWSALASSTCTTDPAQRDDSLTACLADLRRAAGARVTQAAASLAAARRFSSDIELFLSVDECGPEALDGLQPLGPDPALRREVAALRAWSDEVDPAGRDEVAEMIHRAVETGHRPTIARVYLGAAYRNEEMGDAAETLRACARAFDEATAGGSDWIALRASSACIAACSNLGRVDEARRWNGHIEALSRRLDVEPIEHLRGRLLLASALARAGELDEARRLADEIDRRARLGPQWASTALDALAETGMIAIWLDDYAVAVERLELGLAGAEEYHRDDHTKMAMLEGRLAMAYRYVGRYADAETLFIRTLDHPLPPVQRLMTVLNYAQMLADQPERLADAYALLQPAYEASMDAGREDSIEMAHVLAALGQLHLKAQRGDDARRTLLRARALYERLLEPGHIHARNVDQWLAKLDAAP